MRCIIINLEILLFLLVVLYGKCARNTRRVQGGNDRKHCQVIHIAIITEHLNIDTHFPVEQTLYDSKLSQIDHSRSSEYPSHGRKQQIPTWRYFLQANHPLYSYREIKNRKRRTP